MSLIALNKFISSAGICSRRKAVSLIKNGHITVNGNLILEPFYKVSDNDIILYKNKEIKIDDNKVYILLNKPVGYITTTDDELGRKTVLDLLPNFLRSKRLYPIGRLDKDTSGLLIITNDGKLAYKLAHPSNCVKKIYRVKLDRPLISDHLLEIKNGIYLKDGFIRPDDIYYNQSSKYSINIELHSGKNRIVRRIFAYFNYKVLYLDRISYAGIFKDRLKVGSYRLLSLNEIKRFYE
jgi:23S rRNA pseudouridine2605 synthase